MAQDAYSQFQSFNWDSNAQWEEYKSKLEIPSENPNILVLKQQKWFKNNVNADYDPSYRPSQSETKETSEKPVESKPAAETTTEAPKEDSTSAKPRFPLHRFFLLMMNLLAIVHAVFALINLVTPFFLEDTHFTFVFFHSGLSYLILLLQTVGTPKFTQAYATALLNSENLQYVMYCMLFGVTAIRTIALFPVVIYCAINENKARLLLLASNIEIATFVSLVLDIVSGNFNVALPAICCWNFLTTRYRQSSWTKMSISGLEAMGDSYLMSPRCPSMVTALYVKAKSSIAYLATPRRAAPPTPATS